jgi:A/G-specific adenine glycosylase
MSAFAQRVIAWQQRSGRHNLPWQRDGDAYRVWLSEIMLQQTQVAAVVPYFERFVARFASLRALARADEDSVLQLWSGLGYYARARNLHRAARLIVERHGGQFPRRFEDISALPGVGRSTAGAIAVFAFGGRHPILDGNVKRVFARHFGIDGYPGSKAVQDALWARAEAELPRQAVRGYTQGLMDLGATLCTRARPRCGDCPLTQDCIALRQNRVAQLPAPRPRKALPQRATRMLLLVHGGEVLLEKRPSAGVWGGLWCLPELSEQGDAALAARTRFGALIGRSQVLPTVAHGFTHFRLDIHPLLCEVRAIEPRAQCPGSLWLPLEEALGAPIPAPVRAILGAAREQRSGGAQQIDQAL